MKDLFGDHSIFQITTPFASVIETNYIPSQDETVRLRALLVEPQIQLSRLETEISRLQVLLESVILQRDSVKKFIEAHRALMSPIRRLPPETLSEIFTHCLPDRYATRDISEAPLLLTGVSQHWRHTAIDTPALWKSLHIFIPREMSQQGFKKRIVGSSLWVKRSGSLPLTISFSTDTQSLWKQSQTITDIDSTMEGIYTFIAEILLENSNRIKELFFTGSVVPHMATHLNQLASRSFPILKVFRVCHTGLSRYRPTEEPALPFHSLVQRMPALNSLAMVGFPHSSRQFAQLDLAWENLTELVLPPWDTGHSVFSSEEILSILGHACHLQSLTMSVDISTWSAVTTMLNLPSMREMRLNYFYPGHQAIFQGRSCLQNFYHSMVCPSLKTLYASWCGTYDITDMPFSAFSSLEELEMLETLSLDMPLTSDTLIESLSLNPRLKSLEILNKGFQMNDGDLAWDALPLYVHTVDDSVLSSLNLITKKGNHILCPDLQHIRIIYKDHISPRITNSTLLTFLETRFHQTKTLRSCDIFFEHPRADSTEDENRRFRSLVDSGLKLRIRYGRLAPSYMSTSSRDTPKEGLMVINAPNLSDMEGAHGTGIII